MQVSDVTMTGGAESAGPTLLQRFGAVRRRFRPMALVFGLILGAAALLALLWPPTYRSSGTILIEQQEVPTDFVRSAVTSYADQRVQMISQRVMTSANLLGIIDKYKLYPADRDKAARETLVDRMRADIGLRMISADVVDPRAGRTTRATIAFSVSFESRSPVTAAQVANELTTLYLSENVETRKQLAAGATGFLKDESERLGARVSELEGRIAAFKSQHAGELPESQQFTLQLIDRAQSDLRNAESRIYAIDQQLVFLDAQLAQLSPTAPAVSDTGERVLSPAERLRMLQGQLAAAQARYSPDHPDVVRLKREIEGLQAQLGAPAPAVAAPAPADATPAAGAASAPIDAASDIARQLEAAQAELAAARQKYAEDHPDVQRLARQVNALQLALEQTPRRAGGAGVAPGTAAPAAATLPGALAPAARAALAGEADNPAYVQLRAQRTAALNDRAALATQIPALRARIAGLERRQTLAPEVEKEYSALQRDLAGERTKYNEVRQKQLEAQLAQNLETERKGERFALIEPPLQPQQPFEPNRPAILLLGFVFALAAALVLMFILETLDTRIRDRSHLIALLAVPPLAVIPAQALEEEIAARRRFRSRAALLLAALFVLALIGVHFFVQPLDILWLRLMRRLGA
ncbi:MAG: lipopolysaccharide biosynthesis protein [Gammaproteobacteria bacterium]|nr:lipopolysaccharide biosynthesis protein [Gammaproteobacteria bacterium]